MKKPSAGAAAVHGQVGSTHAVGVFALKVLLEEEDGGWFAQGLDIDYAACGGTVAEVKSNFEQGFCATVHEHLVLHGNIDRLLKPASPEVWTAFFSSSKALQFSCIQLHRTEAADAETLAADIPFDVIHFFQGPSRRKGRATVAIPA